MVIGTIGTLIVAASIYWWTTHETHEQQLATKEEQISAAEREIAALKRQVQRLENRPPEIREVIKEVPVPAKPEEEKTAPQAEEPAVEEIVLRVPKAIDRVACLSMDVGKWTLRESCQAALKKRVHAIYDPDRHFLVITPVVDARPYADPLSELKQAGLAQFRAQSATELLKEQLPEDVLILQKRGEQTEDKRGFILELYAR
jgi:hypothetical protein